MKNYLTMDSPAGLITLFAEDGALTGLYFGNRQADGYTDGGAAPLTAAVAQLEEYFDGKRQVFDLPIAMHGTNFQRAVWERLRAIPYGETRSYGEIAREIGNPKAARAVGMANNRNPISIIVPCHRVIGADGSLVGYGGGMETKRRLLDFETAHLK